MATFAHKKVFMIRLSLIAIFSFSFLVISAQSIVLSPKQIEALFLKQNLELVAGQMNISIADAKISEAKVWDNPELSIGDINFWKQRSIDENGKVATYPKQFSVELSQIVSLSARRAKLANVERVDKEITIKQFEELLRSLKMELRSSIAEIIYLQNTLAVVKKQKLLLEEIVSEYRTQYEKGNVTKNELLRLQMALLAVEGETNNTRIEFNAMQKTLKNLLSLDTSTAVSITAEEDNFPAPLSLNADTLIKTALASRPDLEATVLQSEYHRKDITYQKSLAIPDVSIGVKYDRAGGVWDNFFGIGMGIQIPVFNRNKRAIKTARIKLRQNEILILQKQNSVQNEVIRCFENYKIIYTFLDTNMANSTQCELDNMLDVYTQNLLKKNITIIEYMDFMDSYRSAKETFLQNQKELRLQFEQLQFSIGQDIK
jgi:hypothetical protein